MASIIPLSDLDGACQDQLAIVQKEWPNGIPLTEKTAIRIAELNLDICWAAERLLSWKAFEKYERVRASAWAECKRVRAPAWAEYGRVTALAWTECERVKASTLLKLLEKTHNKKMHTKLFIR